MRRFFRQVFFGLAVLTALVLAACSAKAQLITFNHVTYQWTQREGAAEVYQSQDGKMLRVDPTGDGAQVSVDGQVYRVTGTVDHVQVALPDGRSIFMEYAQKSSYGGSRMDEPFYPEDSDRVDELRAIVFGQALNQPRAGEIWRYPVGLLFIAGGVLSLFNPRLYWQISEGWRYQNVEPSGLYLGLIRVGGVVLVIAAVFIVFEF